MKQKDVIYRFLVENTPVRGQLISLDASWQQCFHNSDASEYAKQLFESTIDLPANKTRH